MRRYTLIRAVIAMCAFTLLIPAASVAADLEPTLAADINPGPSSSYPYGLIDLNGGMLLNACGPTGCNPHSFDGKTATKLADIAPNSDTDSPSDLIEFNGFAYFSADRPSEGAELWRTDGTTVNLLLTSIRAP